MRKRKHLAIYIPSLGGGGAERVSVTLANSFADHGLKVDLVLTTTEGPYLSEVSPNVRIIDLGTGRVTTSTPKLISYLRKERPDVLLSSLNYANVISVIARTLARVPTRLIVCEHTNLEQSRTRTRSLRAKTVVPLMKWAYHRADAVVAVSNGVADSLASAIGLPREKIFVVYNPVVTPELIEKSKAPLEHPWLDKDEPPVILAAGRLTQAKDYPTLIRAFAKVRSERECRLVILGKGELRERLEDLILELGIASNVQLLGFVKNPYAWMNRANLFVLSSAWEGLPTSLIEAMACGTPVISTDCPSGPNEILEDGRWGVLVPVGDVEKLAQQILLSLSNGKTKMPTSRSEHFNIQSALHGYLKLF